MRLTERNTWPLWKCIKAENQGNFIEAVWKKFGIDLLKGDKPGKPITYSDVPVDIESLEEIDHLMRQKPRYKSKVWQCG